jgi:sterol desaturase/sphingolipid hydroxylase (fatty acid hydroxylase superfamily)
MLVPDAIVPHLQNIAGSAMVIAMVTIAESRWPAVRQRRLDALKFNIAIGLVGAATAFVFAFSFEVIMKTVPRDGLIGLVIPGLHSRGLLGVAAFVMIYGLVWDFFQYWFHRMQHEMSWMWSSHRVHHSDQTVDATTQLRRSVPELVLYFCFLFIPTIVVAGVHETAMWIAFIVFWGWGFFNHANLRLPLGKLTAVVSGPQWHRLHHGLDREYQNCNYAAYFPVFDILFGTYKAPRKGEFPITGISDAAATASPILDCIAPLAVKTRFGRGWRSD